MTDLEKLITDAQDKLRGRRRDWIDDFGDWRKRIDWPDAAVNVIALATAVIALALLMVPVLR